MFFNTKHTTALCFVTCMAFSSSSIADIVISGTRVIYKSDQKSVNVRLENKGNNPGFVPAFLPFVSLFSQNNFFRGFPPSAAPLPFSVYHTRSITK